MSSAEMEAYPSRPGKSRSDRWPWRVHGCCPLWQLYESLDLYQTTGPIHDGLYCGVVIDRVEHRKDTNMVGVWGKTLAFQCNDDWEEFCNSLRVFRMCLVSPGVFNPSICKSD